MQKKGQGSLEYLLIIGGGILVAVVIIGAIVSLAGTSGGGTKANVANQTCHTYLAEQDCNTATLDIVSTNPTVACATGTNPTTSHCCFNGNLSTGLECYANSDNEYS